MCYFKLYLCVNRPSDQKASGRYVREKERADSERRPPKRQTGS